MNSGRIRASNSVTHTDQAFTGSVISANPSFSAQGTYNNGSGTTITASGPNATAGDAVVVFVQYTNGSGPSLPTFTATYNGSAMTYKGDAAYFTSGAGMSLACFTITGVPAGVKAISISSTISVDWRIQSHAYSNVSTIGSLVTNSGSGGTALSLSVPSASGHMVAQAFATYQISTTAGLTGYSGTQRESRSGALNIWYQSLVIGDAPSTTTTTAFSATAPGTSYWSGAGVDMS